MVPITPNPAGAKARPDIGDTQRPFRERRTALRLILASKVQLFDLIKKCFVAYL